MQLSQLHPPLALLPEDCEDWEDKEELEELEELEIDNDVLVAELVDRLLEREEIELLELLELIGSELLEGLR